MSERSTDTRQAVRGPLHAADKTAALRHRAPNGSFGFEDWVGGR
jgi:hypothetical protein